jgi:hypothetical protein
MWSFSHLLRHRFDRDMTAGVWALLGFLLPDRALGLARSVQKVKDLYMWAKFSPKMARRASGVKFRGSQACTLIILHRHCVMTETLFRGRRANILEYKRVLIMRNVDHNLKSSKRARRRTVSCGDVHRSIAL